MKIRLTVILSVLVLVCSFASVSYGAGGCDAGPFDRFIKPITNPVYFDEVHNRTYVHVVHALQQLPNHIRTEIGRVPLDGTLNLTAVRINFAINERFSLIAAKDGYIDFDPDSTLDSGNGWGDIAAGFKYALIYDPDDEFILSGKVLFELSQGSRDVYQGNGDGNAAPSISFLKGFDKLQLQGTIGGVIPFNHNKESTLLFTSWHASYAVTPEFFPLIEINYFRVIRNGDQGWLASQVARFEGAPDIANLGSKNGTSHRNYVTLALGARYRVFDRMDFGFAWETPLHKPNQGLIQNRYTIDVVFHF